MPYRKATIRPYRPEDEPVLFGLGRLEFGERGGWSDRRTLEALETDTVFVAEVERAAAGYVALESGADAVSIEHLLVAPQHEQEDVERQLLEYAEGYAISMRAQSLRVVVEPDNRTAIDFYRAFGFTPVEAGLLELTLPQE